MNAKFRGGVFHFMFLSALAVRILCCYCFVAIQWQFVSFSVCNSQNVLTVYSFNFRMYNLSLEALELTLTRLQNWRYICLNVANTIYTIRTVNVLDRVSTITRHLNYFEVALKYICVSIDRETKLQLIETNEHRTI